MNELTLFNNPDFGAIRTLETNDGKVLFCGKDVATALGYKDTRHAISANCKGGVKCPVLTNGGKQDMTFIPESDVYRLTFSSKLPNAEKFTDWITEEVIPQILRTGSYSIEQKPMSQLDVLQGMLDVMKTHETRLKAVETVQAEQKEKLDRVAETFEINVKTWRKEANSLVRKIAQKSGESFQKVWLDSYQALEDKAHCKLTTRMAHKRLRMYERGLSPAKLRSISALDVIEDDENLIHHYISVLREMAFKN